MYYPYVFNNFRDYSKIILIIITFRLLLIKYTCQKNNVAYISLPLRGLPLALSVASNPFFVAVSTCHFSYPSGSCLLTEFRILYSSAFFIGVLHTLPNQQQVPYEALTVMPYVHVLFLCNEP